MDRDNDFLIANSSNVDNEVRNYESLSNGRQNEGQKSKTSPQYLAAIAATLSAFAAGIVIGWTAPIENAMEDGNYNNITIDKDQMGWIGSFTNLGALVTCIPTGFICDIIGRKTTLLLLIIPFSIGWSLILTARNVLMLYFGRFIIGMAVGATCVAAPMYTSEIAQKEIRGALGSYFQLMVTVGVLYSYTFGAFLTPMNYTIICSLVPLIFITLFGFQPETPLYYLKVNKFEKAKLALVQLRGTQEVDRELNEIETTLKESRTSVGFFRAMSKKSSRKAIFISFALMFFQQFSGINAIIFYTGYIFKSSGVSFNENYASIVIGATQVIATFSSSLIVDKLGRKILLITSSLFMSLSIISLGVYVYLKSHQFIAEYVLAYLNFLPILCLVLFIIAFSIGFGPIPWMISGEIFSPDIKSMASSMAGSFNWLLAFFITKYYFTISDTIGEEYTYIFFGVVTLLAIPFTYFIVPETKDKTISDIQDELEN